MSNVNEKFNSPKKINSYTQIDVMKQHPRLQTEKQKQENYCFTAPVSC